MSASGFDRHARCFDLDRLEAFALAAIERFAAEHGDELFDGFAIDAALLCLSLASDTEAARAYLASKGEATEQAIATMRRETGDWAYQGFAEMGAEHGFDREAYQDHYNLDDAAQKTSAYGLAMDALLARLIARDAFASLRRTDDFLVIRVEHAY
jgi:hypothetical protein